MLSRMATMWQNRSDVYENYIRNFCAHFATPMLSNASVRLYNTRHWEKLHIREQIKNIFDLQSAAQTLIFVFIRYTSALLEYDNFN